MSERLLFGECLLVAAPGAQNGLLRDVVAPAWTKAGGVEAPRLLHKLSGDRPSPLQGLAEARCVFIDVTGAEPLALYHLGVRDALARRVTIPLIKGTPAPALPDTARARAVSYDDSGTAVAAIVARLDEVFRKDDAHDSPVAAAIPDLRVRTRVPKAIHGTPAVHTWSVFELDRNGAPTATRLAAKVGIVCGDLRAVRGIDVWVNSENTFMEMGRMCDVGISAIIRHLGAKRVSAQFVNDVIQRDLMRAVGARERPVEEGTVFLTGAGALESHGVKRIAHVAAVVAREPGGSGFEPAADLGQCVVNVLDAIPREVRGIGLSRLRPPSRLKSVLFPLMGTGNAGDDARVVSCALIATAVEYVRQKKPDRLEQILFLAYTDFDRDLCRAALNAMAGVREDAAGA
jgi:O-acetyl-ADP-ribose deacetylase (regulator of RNase III)